MVIKVDKLKDVGIQVTAQVNGQKYRLPDSMVIELYFENGKFPQELHDAIRKLMPGQQIEADIIGEGTMRKINDFLMLQAINTTGESK